MIDPAVDAHPVFRHPGSQFGFEAHVSVSHDVTPFGDGIHMTADVPVIPVALAGDERLMGPRLVQAARHGPAAKVALMAGVHYETVPVLAETVLPRVP